MPAAVALAVSSSCFASFSSKLFIRSSIWSFRGLVFLLVPPAPEASEVAETVLAGLNMPRRKAAERRGRERYLSRNRLNIFHAAADRVIALPAAHLSNRPINLLDTLTPTTLLAASAFDGPVNIDRRCGRPLRG
jgi:hypothetical protein